MFMFGTAGIETEGNAFQVRKMIIFKFLWESRDFIDTEMVAGDDLGDSVTCPTFHHLKYLIFLPIVGCRDFFVS